MIYVVNYENMNETPKRILVVDDEHDVTELLKYKFEQWGYFCETINDPYLFIAKARDFQPDLIVMDVMMPGLDGYEACKLLKENAATSDIPVIFVTSRAETADKVKGLDMGGVDYITKPFQLAEVMARVNTHLRLKSAHEENLEYHKVLLQTQKMASISTLAGGVAHNINNLMGAVIGYADMLQEGLDHNDRAYHYTDKVLAASQRASDLASDLLTYARARHSDISSVDMLELLKEYVAKKQKTIDAANSERGIDLSATIVNGRRQTNLGIFRAYLQEYLHDNPKIHKGMTFLVRHLQPTPQGLPIEIYVFSADKNWVSYEAIQADIFDHVLAALPEFGLRVYQQPSGMDIASLKLG